MQGNGRTSFLTEEELEGPLVRLPAAPVEFMMRKVKISVADESDAFHAFEGQNSGNT